MDEGQGKKFSASLSSALSRGAKLAALCASLYAVPSSANAQLSEPTMLSLTPIFSNTSVLSTRAESERRFSIAPHGTDFSCYLDENKLQRIATTKKREPYKIMPQESVQRVVLHQTVSDERSSYQKLCRSANAQYMISKNGLLTVFGPESWNFDHAGFSIWNGERNISRGSVGIEFVGKENEDLTPQQEETGRWLVSDLALRHGLDREKDFVWHYQVAATFYLRPDRNGFIGFRGRRNDGVCVSDATLGVRRPQIDSDAASGRIKADSSLAQLRTARRCTPNDG